MNYLSALPDHIHLHIINKLDENSFQNYKSVNQKTKKIYEIYREKINSIELKTIKNLNKLIYIIYKKYPKNIEILVSFTINFVYFNSNVSKFI